MAPNTKRIKLAELLSKGSVKLDLKGNDRDAVLIELVAQIKELYGRNDAHASLVEALKERESLHSTGIGDGVALPHARNALVGLVDHPVVVMGRHNKGVNYGAIDGSPVKLFFLLIAPTVTEHLGIIARLSRALRNAKLRSALLEAATPQEVIELFEEAEAAG